MKILHVILSLDERWGGPPRGLANLARTQAQRGHKVAVVPGEPPCGPQTLYPGQYGNLRVYASPTQSRLFWYDYRLKRLLRRAGRGCDLVHIHGSWRYHLLGAAATAREYGIPYIVRPAGNMGRVSLRKRQRLKSLYYLVFERSVYNGAAAIQCCSGKELRELEDFHMRPRKFIVPQPIESNLPHITPDFEQFRTRCPDVKDRDRVILFLGRIAPVKRADVLLEAFVRLSREFGDWHLILAGPHEDTGTLAGLRRRIAETGLGERVSVPGLVTDGLKAACFARADVFAQPSLHENFGMSVAEALLMGLPCIVSDGVALAEDIEEGEAGIVCEPTVEAFETALRRMIGDERLRESASQAARAVAQRFDPIRVAEQLDREYEQCLIP